MAAYTTIDDPEAYFQTKLYSGTGSSNAQTFDGDTDMQPDLTWFKKRGNESHSNYIFDSVRGVNKPIHSDNTNAESSQDDTLMSFNSDGFTIGEDSANGEMNSSSDTFVAWCWKESATAGFDILLYTGNATNRTISHNLSAVPQVVIVKRRDSSTAWSSLHLNGPGSTHRMSLNDTSVKEDDATFWQDTDPTSSVFTLGTSSSTNVNTGTYVAYLFSEKQGFSKFGVYTGNGNADGTFIYTGFRPAWVMIKRTDATNGWEIYDNKRVGYNTSNSNLRADTTAADDATYPRVDLHSNGFKIRASSTGVNTSGSPYIYMAFAEAPFVNSNGVPCNAR